MFQGFTTVDVDVRHRFGGTRIHAEVGGSGPPVLLVHGFPESHVMWRAVAEALAREHTVVAADLRGYGRSGVPDDTTEGGEPHSGYSFRVMAADLVELMAGLGHERFAVVGHDRGARVTHRMALDHPQAVERAALLDILPTTHVYDAIDARVATAYYHWFFFIQPEPLPERLIAADPLFYLHRLLALGGGGLHYLAPDALAEYERAFADPDRRHAMLEDYRAAASIDVATDRADADAGAEVSAPLLLLWGAHGVVGSAANDVLAIWRTRARTVSGRSVDAGHFLAEERPAQVLEALAPFLAGESPATP